MPKNFKLDPDYGVVSVCFFPCVSCEEVGNNAQVTCSGWSANKDVKRNIPSALRPELEPERGERHQTESQFS